MNGFWDFLIRPALEAADCREIVEVGSEGGAHTVRLLDWCAEVGARLHVIEPEPQYDVDALRASHPGRLVFHESTSLEVLDKIDGADAVLLDGDHNWYTVHHELLALERAHGERFPLVFLHDVAWPFARRDMYYAPARIPGDYRHPYSKGGLRRGEEAPVQNDGLAPELYKALHEGGPRNGVLTAVEDFLARTPLRLRFELLPVDFGLGLVASEALLDAKPALRALFDQLGTPEFGFRLARHTEERRIDTTVPLQRELDRLRIQKRWVVDKLGTYQAELVRHQVEVKRLRELLDASQAEIAHAREGAIAQGAELARWQQHAQGLEARVDERTQALEGWQQHARGLEARVDERTHALEGWQGHARGLEARVEELRGASEEAARARADAARLALELAAVTGSRSWRFTRPLRALGARLRRRPMEHGGP